jgi:hypothetical protein
MKNKQVYIDAPNVKKKRQFKKNRTEAKHFISKKKANQIT